MLVLTRREGERVVLLDESVNPPRVIGHVRVCSFRNNQVRLGFAFPPSITVHREEVALEIENKREGNPR